MSLKETRLKYDRKWLKEHGFLYRKGSDPRRWEKDRMVIKRIRDCSGYDGSLLDGEGVIRVCGETPKAVVDFLLLEYARNTTRLLKRMSDERGRELIRLKHLVYGKG